jgi:dihydrofolate reductase
LDGVIEAPGGGEDYRHAGWTLEIDRGDEGDRLKFDELMASDAQLLGRLTYEGFAKAWPTMERTGEFGEKMNEMPKVVVSTTLENPEWNNTTVVGGDLAAEVDKLKQQFAGDILVAGSAQLVQSLLEQDLVDELRLMVFPVVLGSGKRLFGETSEKKRLRLVDSKTVGEGVAVLVYERARE